MAAMGSARADAPKAVVVFQDTLDGQAVRGAHDGTVIQLLRGLGMTFVCKAGNVEIRADEGDFYLDTNEAELRGNVRIKNVPDGVIESLLEREHRTVCANRY